MPSFGFDPSAIAPAVANRALERETWAQACLAAHAGSVFVFAVGPVATTLRIDAAGKVESVSEPEGPPVPQARAVAAGAARVPGRPQALGRARRGGRRPGARGDAERARGNAALVRRAGLWPTRSGRSSASASPTRVGGCWRSPSTRPRGWARALRAMRATRRRWPPTPPRCGHWARRRQPSRRASIRSRRASTRLRRDSRTSRRRNGPPDPVCVRRVTPRTPAPRRSGMTCPRARTGAR